MNVPAAIEKTIADMIREFCDLPENTTIRAWQSIDHDATWDSEQDRTFPMVEVRCSPPFVDDNQTTLRVNCAVMVATSTPDDKTHAVISDMFTSVLGMTDALFSQRPGRSSGPESDSFLIGMHGLVGEEKFRFHGITYGDGQAPYDDRGVNVMGITVAFYYSRDDF
jgi:hypothetical protein